MPRTTRAVDRSSHIRASADTRAVHGSSHHSSSSESLESGRERRRRGKLKMQHQLTDAHSRISDLEQQNHCLRCLVEELTRSIALPAGPASPELFDVYDIAEETASVATQTEISVNLQSPDVFVRAEDLPACAAEQCAAESHDHSLAIAHADAAAGLDVAQESMRQELVVGAKDLQSRDLAYTACLTQSGPLPLDSNSQDLACSPGLDEHESQQLGSKLTRQALDDAHAKHRVRDDGHETGPDLTRQALDDVHAKHRAGRGPGPNTQDSTCVYRPHAVSHLDVNAVTSLDLDSQSLAHSTESPAYEPCLNSQDLACMSGPPADSHLDVTVDASLVFDSQSLAHTSRPSAFENCVHVPQCGPELQQPIEYPTVQDQDKLTRQALDDVHAKHRVKDDRFTTGSDLTRQALEDVHAKHRVRRGPGDNSQDFTCVSGPLAVSHLGVIAATSLELDSQSLARSSEFSAHEHCVNSQDIACLSGPHADSHLDAKVDASLVYDSPSPAQASGPSPLESSIQKCETLGTTERGCHATDVAQQTLPSAFVDVATNIIGVYRKRKRPLRSHIITAASALERVSRMHGVSRAMCEHFVEGKSLALRAALDECW